MNSMVAVTGADGFIGSHLVETLVDRGHRVRAMVQYNSFGSHGWLDSLAPDVLDEVEVEPGDVRDRASVRELVRDAEVVYHLAALITIPYSYRAPQSYVDTNVAGTLNVLEAARDLRTPRLVHTSTSETYGTAQRVPIDESHPIHAQSPYAATKVAADQLVASYHASFGVQAVTLRPFNTFGPRQSARAFIPTVISQIAADTGAVEVGSLAPTRDFSYVKDTADAFVAVGTAPAADVVGEVFNSGTGHEISMGDLARTIAGLMGAAPEFRSAAARERPAASEVMRLVCDSGKLRRATGWRHRHTLEEGLKDTVEWFLDPANLARYRPSTYNI
ncbi:NAD-dependent epimerase/dehydratase family protein [Actinomadura decatromicini]|uniref:NAD-dependent epimerase/dehydratase family protein n=1 Tax=Actinomadura decatromicini TaxID=2604572 RepID=A0A5D3FXY8_9ACTN|nr:NAD-dependent epimerase/dehydratase family protein [Actinomadura decatromicini]